MTTTKPRNRAAQDATLINIRSLRKKLDAYERRDRRAIADLRQGLTDLTTRVLALEHVAEHPQDQTHGPALTVDALADRADER